jgi:hypothetical protein
VLIALCVCVCMDTLTASCGSLGAGVNGYEKLRTHESTCTHAHVCVRYGVTSCIVYTVFATLDWSAMAAGAPPPPIAASGLKERYDVSSYCVRVLTILYNVCCAHSIDARERLAGGSSGTRSSVCLRCTTLMTSMLCALSHQH